MSIIKSIRAVNRQRNIKTKKIKIKLKLFVIKLRYRKRALLASESYKSVCIFMHTQAIGDGIVTSGFIKSLMDRGLKVYVIAPERVRFLFIDIIGVDGFIPFNKERAIDLLKEMKQYQIDLVVDFSNFDGTVMHRLKTLLSINPKYAIGFNQPRNTIFDTNIVDGGVTRGHITGRMREVLTTLGFNSCDYSGFLKLDRCDFNSAHAFARTLKKDFKGLVIFNPFGSQDDRALSIPQINEVLHYLNNLNGFVTIVFNMGRSIKCAHFDNVMMTPFKDAGNCFALVGHATFVITVDTAIVHLASVLNIPQYCIYNNRLHDGIYENNVLWGPNSEVAVQLTTSEYKRTEIGDDMQKFDVSLLINAINEDFVDQGRLVRSKDLKVTVTDHA